MRLLQKLSSDIWRGVYELTGAFFYIFWKNKRLASLTYFGIILNLISWGLLYWLFSTNLSGLILHYNAFLGIDLFAYLGDEAPLQLEYFISPLSGLSFLLINVLISLCLLCLSPEKAQKDQKPEPKIELAKDKFEQPDVYLFGAYLIMSGNIVLQASILVYTISVIIVNK